MKAPKKDYELARRFWNRGINQVERSDCNVLRRAELTLHRWHEYECGFDSSYNWRGRNVCRTTVIERDGINRDGKPFYVHHGDEHGGSTMQKQYIPDRERGALKRIDALCARLGLYYYVQTDPRGASLFVSNEPLTDQNYSSGVCCSV